MPAVLQKHILSRSFVTPAQLAVVTKHFRPSALTSVIQERQMTSLCGVSPILHRSYRCHLPAHCESCIAVIGATCQHIANPALDINRHIFFVRTKKNEKRPDKIYFVMAVPKIGWLEKEK